MSKSPEFQFKSINSLDNTDLYKNYDIKNNVSEPIMYPYEYTQCLGMRARQFELNAEPRIELTKDLNTPLLIAEAELYQRKTPFILERKISSKKCDYWKIEDLTIPHDLV